MKILTLPSGERLNIDGASYQVEAATLVFILPNGVRRTIDCGISGNASTVVGLVDTFMGDPTTILLGPITELSAMVLDYCTPNPVTIPTGATAGQGDIITLQIGRAPV